MEGGVGSGLNKRIKKTKLCAKEQANIGLYGKGK